MKNIPLDGWIEYRQWRKEEGWKLIGTDKGGNIRNGTTKLRKPPKDSSINREVTMIQEWFKHMLVPERIAIASPVIEKTKVRRVDLTANPPFTPSDYTKIQRRFRKWSEDKTAKSPEWRKVVYHFFLICTNVGWRPDSEGLATKWSQLKVRKRIDQIHKSDEEGGYIGRGEDIVGLLLDKNIYGDSLGNFTLNKGVDDKGHYISYYDKWDVNPLSDGDRTSMIPRGLDDAIQSALTGNKTPSSALKGAQKSAEKLLRRYK